MNTLIKPRIPLGSEPSRDDDPTGVRALLSSLPEPAPMPAHLVERINASLAAEQAQRTAKASHPPVVPLRSRARPGRALLVSAVAGAAAAAVLAAVVATTMFEGRRATVTSARDAVASSSSGSPAAGAAAAPAPADTASALAGGGTASLVQIGQSGVRYTQADFVGQVQTLRRASVQPPAGESSGLGPAGTAAGLRQCLGAIGAAAAQVVRADVGFYQGQPAVIIVATTNGQATAYAVGRGCSPTDPAELRPATPLP